MTASDTVAATAAAPSDAMSLKRWQLIALLGALSMFAPLSTDMYLPALPSLAHNLHASASATQLTLTASMLGLGGGQLLAGPLSDSFGRRRPVLLGLVAYTLSSVGCAFCNDVLALSALRLVQGAAGAAGIVVARAIVRDLYDGVEAARLFSRLIVVFGMAPILAPIIGGQLLHVTDWRGIFVVLAAIGAVLVVLGWRYLAETLPVEARHRGGVVSTLRVLGVLIRNRSFAGLTLIYGLMFGAVFAYIAGSPFIVENIFGFSPQLFGLVFAINAAALVSVSQFGIRFISGTGPRRLAQFGLAVMAVVGVLLLVGVIANVGPGLVLPCFFVLLGSYGLVSPNLTALAMAPFPQSAGSASALMGIVQFWTGAAVAPLVGLSGTHDATPTALVIAVACVASFVVWWLSVAHRTPRTLAGEPA